MHSRGPLFALALLGAACRSDPAPAESSTPCSAAPLERAAAELRALPPERNGDRERLVLEALHSSCAFVPNRLSLFVARFGGEYVDRTEERAAMHWELSSEKRQVARFSDTPEFAALVAELGWNAEVTRSFTRSALATAAVSVELLLQESGVSPRDRQTIAWAVYAQLGRAVNVWPRVELARVPVRGTEIEFDDRLFEPTHLHIAPEGWSLGVWKPEPSPWLPAHEDWRTPQTSLGPPPTRIDPPKQGLVKEGVVQMFVAADVSVGRLRAFIDAVPVPGCDRPGPCSSFVHVDFVVVSDHHGPDFTQLAHLPIWTSSTPPDCEEPERECVVALPVREVELLNDRLEAHARNRVADVVIVDEHAIEVRTAGTRTLIGLLPDASLRESLQRLFGDGDAPSVRPAVVVIARPGLRWQTIATVVGALQGRECDQRDVAARGCRFEQVGLCVSE